MLVIKLGRFSLYSYGKKRKNDFGELGQFVCLGLCAVQHCGTFAAALRYNLFLFCHPELVEVMTNKKRISTSIRQPFGSLSFFIFYHSGVEYKDIPILGEIIYLLDY